MQTVRDVTQERSQAASLFGWVLSLFYGLNAALDALQPLAALLARGYVAEAFFKSGLTKLRDWDITLALFQDEYKVPLLPPDVAAVMGTGGELGLFPKSSGLHSVRVDGGEIEFSGNQEDDCPDGSDSFEAACTAFCGLE
jgi:hypothetical protein